VGAIKTTTLSILAISLLAGSTLGVVAQDADPEEAVEFTAQWTFGNEIRADVAEAGDGATRYEGGAWRPVARTEATDPRLQGALSVARNSIEYDDGPEIASVVFRIENDDGAWTMTPTISLTDPDLAPKSDVGVFVGEGDYEGLLAVTRIDTDRGAGTWDLRGYVVEAGLPPPEPYITE
jgi:hypothetical protein